MREKHAYTGGNKQAATVGGQARRLAELRHADKCDEATAIRRRIEANKLAVQRGMQPVLVARYEQPVAGNAGGARFPSTPGLTCSWCGGANGLTTSGNKRRVKWCSWG